MLTKDASTCQTPVVLITRPEGQQLAFSQGCRKLGYCVALLPCLEIIPRRTDPTLLDQLLNSHGTALFTSANAVRHTHRVKPFPWPGQQVHAIGAATAQVLSQHNQPLALVPQAPFNSEAYIEQLTHEQPDSLLIIKGNGGRELIQTQLAAHGWQISTIDVYERVRPNVPANDIDALFTVSPPDIISVTSDEVLTNLWHLCHNWATVLVNIPLVTNSQRCAQLAKELGFQSAIIVAIPAGDKGQLLGLADWKKNVFETCL